MEKDARLRVEMLILKQVAARNQSDLGRGLTCRNELRGTPLSKLYTIILSAGREQKEPVPLNCVVKRLRSYS